MQVVLSVPYLAKHDAIGNDTLLIQKALSSVGISCSVFASQCDQGMEGCLISESDFTEIISSPNNLWVYQHGVYWADGMNNVYKSQCKSVLRYHNVTPDRFFRPYDSEGTLATRLGRKQTEDLVKSRRFDHFAPASPYNSSELEAFGIKAKDITIIAPFSKLEEFDSCQLNLSLSEKLKNKGLFNILMVGRLSPNKGHRHLIETLKVFFEMYGPKARLNLVGNITPNFVGYAEELVDVINREELGAYVELTTSVSFDDLFTYYKCADIFLCLSEHEGFCLPIIEAQYLDLPVLTVDRCAMGDTVGEGQIKWKTYDPPFFAKALHRVFNDAELKKQLIANGHKNVEKYRFEPLKEKFRRMVEVLAMT